MMSGCSNFIKIFIVAASIVAIGATTSGEEIEGKLETNGIEIGKDEILSCSDEPLIENGYLVKYQVRGVSFFYVKCCDNFVLQGKGQATCSRGKGWSVDGICKNISNFVVVVVVVVYLLLTIPL